MFYLRKKTLRENTRPYRYHGLKIFTSLKLRFQDFQREQLEIIPAQIKVIEHVQVKYACRACENGIISAPKPAQPIPRSFASPSLLAYIIVAKFMN
ncbi:IS66 family transposase zinc-finger binding domain-containing protein [Bathymodiolus platifrons methanotrophic gill symbiont]|uniref:IS66 family transposase zinc-finger binding domain-containing protein n=1 Tax=Bathymodiolus platifrons methanotrophic gill symbiont TaxID=113268 RepID=UPI001C8EF980|nr:IS66 family transposase zinc-finger binding domain-containing protein [Bathymodiolus platifrons methanotrophic gill symbiont]